MNTYLYIVTAVFCLFGSITLLILGTYILVVMLLQRKQKKRQKNNYRYIIDNIARVLKEEE